MENALVIGMVSGYSDPLSLEKNYSQLEQLVMAYKNVDLLTFGELFLLRDPNVNDSIMVTLERILENIQQLAESYDLAISVGYPHRSKDGMTIRQSVYFPDNLPYHYDKVHLGKNEALQYRAGDCIESFEYRGFRFAIQLCIDTHVPEMTLAQKLKGAEIILAPFNTPYSVEKRLQNWKKYIPARAYEYNLFYCCHNTNGGSLGLDGYGDIIAESHSQRDVQVVTISKETAFSKKIDYLAYRRPEIYDI